MKRKNSLEEISTKRQKVAPVKGVEAEIEEMEADFPDLSARIAALSPALELAVRAGDAVQVSAIIQQYNDYVDATYSDHIGYDFTPSISVELEHLGVLANRMGFDEIADILGYEDNQESEDDEDTNIDFPELLARLAALSPALELAVRAGDAVQVSAIIQEYNDYVDATYSDHVDYGFTPSISVDLEHLGVLANRMGFDEIADILGYEDNQESEDDEDTNTRFPGLPEIIESLSPALTAAVESNNAVQVAAIIQQYDNYVYITYGEHIVPSYVELALGPLAVLAHERGFHEICTVFQYEDCQLSGAEPSFEL